MNWMMVAWTAFLLLLLVKYLVGRIYTVGMNSIVAVMNWAGGIRHIGQGVHFIWPWESIVDNSLTSINEVTDSFTANFEAKDKTMRTFKVSFQRTPSVRHYTQYCKISPESRRSGVVEQLRGMITAKTLKAESMDHVTADLMAFSSLIEKEFEESKAEDKSPFEHYYGENIQNLIIADQEPPKELADVATRREIQEKENEINLEKIKNLNQVRELEMEKLDKLARDMVKASEEMGSKMTYELARDYVERNYGKGNVKKGIKIHGLDKQTLEFLGGVLREVTNGRGK